MQWDVFCRVIDNFGDIGVCWRLVVDLAERGHLVRLWVDDARALPWMAPQVQWHDSTAFSGPDIKGEATLSEPLQIGEGQSGVQVLHWHDAERTWPDLPGLHAGDVVVEAFGCNPPDAFIARMQQRAAQGQAPHWINLEYLSAEDYVERSHRLASPVWAGAGKGLSKYFFYPGFTPRTGGLLREADLLARRQRDTAAPAQRAALLSSLGVRLQPADRVVMVFCYDTAPLTALLDRLDRPSEPCTHVLLAQGAAARQGLAWQPAHAGNSRVTRHELPHLPQPVFDQLLWCSDLNFVRGEDTAVRALWPGRPHVWHIYPQDDGVHAGKLQAFMDRWMPQWPVPLRAQVAAWWLAWNDLGPMPDALPAFDAGSPWRAASEAARADLLKQADLVTQLVDFVTSSG
jgi:uncharacterized repeat protein (TIGR03837 family)